MSHSINMIRFLFCNIEWDLVAIQNLLTRYSSDINRRIFSGDTILHFVLKNEKCSAAIVRLLLQYGASTLITDKYDFNPMEIALRYQRDEGTLLALVARGALVNDYFVPYFCLAVFHRAPLTVIDKIIKIGRGLGSCRSASHEHSVFNCAMVSPQPDRTLAILKMLLEAGFSVKMRPELLCFALRCGNTSQTINFLLKNGVIHSCPEMVKAPGSDIQIDSYSKMFKKCRNHASFWFCMTSTALVSLDVSLAQILLRFHDCDTLHYGLLQKPIQVVLMKCKYELEAIKLMLDSILDLNLKSYVDIMNNSLLHLAVQNKNCLPSVVKLLIKKGVDVNHINKMGDAALDEAVINANCPEIVAIILLENGSTLNPRTVALARNDAKLLKLLLATGISLGKMRHLRALESIANCINSCPKHILYFQYLLRYYLLEYSDYDMPYLRSNHTHYDNIVGYRDRCVEEVTKLKSSKVDPNSWASDLLGKNSSLRGAATKMEDKMPVFNSLLKAVSGESFPLYRFIIIDKVSRPVMEKTIYQTKVYVPKFVDKERFDIVLNNDCLRLIVPDLTDAELFNLISAYFKWDPSMSSAKDSRRKRNAESAEVPFKLLKLEE